MSRKLLWNDLQRFAHNLYKPWLVLRDFNQVTCQNENLGGGLFLEVEHTFLPLL